MDTPQAGDCSSKERNKKVGNYLLGRKLGEGRYTCVRLATHIIAQEKVAVKVVSKKILTQNEAARRHFRRQALLAQYVQHPNIVRLYEAMETSNSYYLVFELADRGQLRQYVAQRRCVPEEEARNFASQIISAVDHLHVSGIVHRDLRLDNFLMDTNNQIKLNDFGHGSFSTSGSHQHGSPAYSAPEVLNGKLGGPAADIWSIGVCLYTMLSGRHPFVSENPTSSQMHYHILQGCSFPDHISQSCKDFVCGLLEPSESKRLVMEEILRHPWIADEANLHITRYPPILKLTPDAVDLRVIRYLCQDFHFDENSLLLSVREKKVDAGFAAYQLMLKHIENGFILPYSNAHSDTTSTLSSDSALFYECEIKGTLPEVKTSSSSSDDSTDPVSYKSSLNHLCGKRLKRTQSKRPVKLEIHPSPVVKPSFVPSLYTERLPEIKDKRNQTYSPTREILRHGPFSRHRDSCRNSDLDILNIRGKSPIRNKGLRVNNSSVTPQVFGFDPPVPPNTASGSKRLCLKAEKSGQKAKESPSKTSQSMRENITLSPLEREKSRILCAVDFNTPKRPMTYGEPLSCPKVLTTRAERSATLAVFKKFTEQNAVRRAIRWNTHHTIYPSSSSSGESEERGDIFNPVIKVTISTCKS